jgi:hypothetical protein
MPRKTIERILQPFFKAGLSPHGKSKSKTDIQPMVESFMKSETGTFKHKLAVFFVERDCFSVTKKAIEQFREPGEEHFGKHKLKALVRARIANYIKDGVAGDLFLVCGYIRPNPDWKRKSHRVDALNSYMEFSGKGAKDVIKDDFDDNGMRGLLANTKNSLYEALVESGHAYSIDAVSKHSMAKKFWSFKIYPWQMSRAPPVFHDKDVRVAAVRWMVLDVTIHQKKEIKNINADDFAEHGLRRLLYHTESCHYAALAEAGYAFTFDEVHEHSRKMRFDNMSGKLYPWEMDMAPTRYDDPRMRRAATRWMALDLRKPERDIERKDFADYGIRGALAHHNSLFAALDEAGLVKPGDKEYIRRRDPRFAHAK